MHIFTQHVLQRALERFPLLRGTSYEDLRTMLSLVVGIGELIPCVVKNHALRRAYLVRVAGGKLMIVNEPRKGAQEIIVSVHFEDDGTHFITVFNRTHDLPEAEVDHPRKRAPRPQRIA